MTESAPIISIKGLTKTYDNEHQALKGVDLDIREGEILALLGPNGAGKTTLISAVCGLVSPTSGTVTVAGYDIIKDFRKTREIIGLVPQELTLGAFEQVGNTVAFSRGLFGKEPNAKFIDDLLDELTLGDKKTNMVQQLSGGMKRRVLIAKALSHEPRILFLDEPTAGVDVELRKDMWSIVERLRQSGVTIILTTHYIEEAEEIADRVGVISGGELLELEDKKTLMEKLGKKQLVVELKNGIDTIPSELDEYGLELSTDGFKVTYTFDARQERTGMTTLLTSLSQAGLVVTDLNTRQSSLEDIFVDIVKADA